MSLRIIGSLPHGPSYALLLIAKGLAVGPDLPAKGRLSPLRPNHTLGPWSFPPGTFPTARLLSQGIILQMPIYPLSCVLLPRS